MSKSNPQEKKKIKILKEIVKIRKYLKIKSDQERSKIYGLIMGQNNSSSSDFDSSRHKF